MCCEEAAVHLEQCRARGEVTARRPTPACSLPVYPNSEDKALDSEQQYPTPLACFNASAHHFNSTAATSALCTPYLPECTQSGSQDTPHQLLLLNEARTQDSRRPVTVRLQLKVRFPSCSSWPRHLSDLQEARIDDDLRGEIFPQPFV